MQDDDAAAADMRLKRFLELAVANGSKDQDVVRFGQEKMSYSEVIRKFDERLQPGCQRVSHAARRQRSQASSLDVSSLANTSPDWGAPARVSGSERMASASAPPDTHDDRASTQELARV